MSGAEPFAAWIGRSEERVDIASAAQVAGLAALLDDGDPDWRAGELPPLAHWLHFRPDAPQSALGEDGHPRRGPDALLPPFALPRRMWAGSRVDFCAAVPIGAAMNRRTTVRSIAPKTGRSGAMVFVTLEHKIVVGGRVAIREQQDLVYREAAAPGAPVAPSRLDAGAVALPVGTRTLMPKSTHLFRYSALTFNAHRIHYDRDYARNTEGYPTLVVQGPFLATLLLAHFMRHRPGQPVRAFSFRAQAPAFEGEALDLRIEGTQLEASSGGKLCMLAQVDGHG